MRPIQLLAALLFLCQALSAVAQTFPDRERRAVVDAANVIPDAEEAALDARLIAWNRETGHQFVVATVPSLEGHEIEDYGNRLLRHWGLGRAGADDGVILMLAPNERQVRIEVGYGLEGVLTDALAGRIIREEIRPALRAGDIGGALTIGADRIMAAAVADPADTQAMALSAERTTRRGGLSIGMILLIGFFALVLTGIVAILIHSARNERKWKREEEQWEKDAPKRERARRTRQMRRWEKLKAEGKTPFETFEDFYADYLDRQRKKEQEESRRRLAERQQRESSHQHSAHSGAYSHSASDDYGWSSGSSSYDSGFDSGGGSGGGGGADSSY